MNIVGTMATGKIRTKTNNKDDRIYVRLNSQLKRDFEAVAEFRGLNPSAMLHSYVVQTIHKIRGENPEIFINSLNEVPIEVETGKIKNESSSQKLVAKKNKKVNKSEDTFTTGDGKTILLVDEGSDDK